MNLIDTLPAPSYADHDGVRYLHFNTRFVQGAMRLDDPFVLELDYAQRMMAWLLWRPVSEMPDGHAVQLGLGAGALTRFCHTVLELRTTAVELNPSVIAVNRRWFNLPDDDRLCAVQDDAQRWVADPANAGSAQVLNVDLYDHECAAPVLDSEAFYADCRDVLDEDGVMTVNLFGRDADVLASGHRIAASFGAAHVWLIPQLVPCNTVVVAARRVRPPSEDELSRRIEEIEQRLGLPASAWLRLVKPLSALA
jgi:spermidine synthase